MNDLENEILKEPAVYVYEVHCASCQRAYHFDCTKVPVKKGSHSFVCKRGHVTRAKVEGLRMGVMQEREVAHE